MDKPIYRMSSAGKCPRALSAIRLNIPSEPPPAWLETSAEEGNWHEQRIKKQLTIEGHLVYDEQLELNLEFPTFILQGHIDGKIASTDDTPDMLLEIKSMSQYEFDRWMRGKFTEFPNYAAQLTCYLKGTNLKSALYYVKNRNSGYTNIELLDTPPANFDDIVRKITDVESAVINGEIYPAEFNPNSIECKRCAFKALCIPDKQALTLADEALLLQAAKDYRKGVKAVEEGEELIASAKTIFGNQSIVAKLDKWRFDDLIIQLIKYKDTITYPKEKLLKVFSIEQLSPASEIRPGYNQVRITDMAGKEK